MTAPRVLIGCEYSGVVRDAFRRLGFEAWSCDLEHVEPEGEFLNYHLAGDVRIWLEEPPFGPWDLFIVHPDCTYLTSSGLHWNKRVPGRAQKTEAALAFVRYLLGAKVPRIALENPIGCIGTRIRPANQIIQPYQFGHDASKATCLWLKNLPELTPTQWVTGRSVCGHEPQPYVEKCPVCGKRYRWANQTDSGQNRLSPSPTRSKDRARTYEGWANAFANQWGKLLWPAANR